MAITLLGGVTIEDAAVRLNPRDRVVLATLAFRHGETVRAEQLADAVWGDSPPVSWSKNLQGCISRLRKVLGPEAIHTSGSGYRLAVADDDVDIVKFEQLARRGRELLELGQAERATYMFGEALELWRGEPLVELEDWEPGRVEAARLEELKLETEELAVEAALQSGHHLDVLARARSLAESAPLRERRWELLARAQYQEGQQSEALRTIRRFRSVLARELGLDPGPGLVSLEQAILRQDPTLEIDDALGQPSNLCPYQGLKPYDVEDAESFFGRDVLIETCLERLGARDLLAVVGPSGSGKSSLVRAGVAARLRRQGARVVVMTPGPQPFDAVSGGRGLSAGTVLVVDQFEELFSLCQDEEQRESFVGALVGHTQRGAIVLAMRADHMGDLAAHPRLAELVESGLHLLSPMDEDQLRAAVDGPARQAGLVVEPGLVDLLIREVRGEPGALPLLSHVLRETWLRREGRTLTVEGYRASGGIRQAVAQSAESVFMAIDPGQQRVLRDLLLRLVTPGPEGAPIRTRMPRRLVISDSSQDALVDLLIASRLVISDDGVVELAHEVLAEAWPRLRGWLDDDVEGQRLLHHLTQAADAWDALGRPDSELYRGTRLARALEWRASTKSELTPAERAFLDEGRRQAEREEQSAVERARTQARLIHRLRTVLAGAAVLLVAALIAGGLALHQRQVANDSAAAARDAATTAEAGRAGARAVGTEDIDKSLLLAVAGVRLDDSPETRSSLLATLGRHPELIGSTQMTGPPAIYFDLSPDGRTVATYDEANHVRLYELGTGELLAEYQAGSTKKLNWVTAEVKFSPDGQTLAVTVAAPTRQPVTLLDAHTLEPMPVQPGGLSTMRWQLIDLAYSQDGQHLAGTMFRVRGHKATTRSTTAWAAAWDLDSPRRPIRLIRLPDGNPYVALSPHGDSLYTTQPFTIHDLASGESKVMNGVEPESPLAMSPDGRVLATAAGGGLELLNTQTGQVRRRLPGNDDDGYFVNFSGDGSLVGTVTFDKQEALVWDVATGALRAQVPLGERSDVVDFGPDGSTFYTAGTHSSLRQWDLTGRRRFVSQVASVPTELGDDSGVQPGPGGDFVAYPNEDRVAFLDVRAGTVGDAIDLGRGYRHRGGTWHPDGVHYALASGGQVRIFDARSAEVSVKGRPAGKYVSDIDYSTDGSRLVIGELSGRVTMLNPATVTPIGRPVQLDEAVCCVSAGPDNRTAIALTGFADASEFWASSISGWALIDLEAGTVLDEGELGIDGSRVAFSPDGRHVAVGGGGGELLVLDAETGKPARSPVVAHDNVASLTYSADGKRILTSGLDSTVALWDAETGRLLSRVVVPERLLFAGFGKDPDSVLIAALWGGPVYEWDTRVDYAVDFACQIAGRDLTPTEWHENFGDRPYRETCPAQ